MTIEIHQSSLQSPNHPSCVSAHERSRLDACHAVGVGYHLMFHSLPTKISLNQGKALEAIFSIHISLVCIICSLYGFRQSIYTSRHFILYHSFHFFKFPSSKYIQYCTQNIVLLLLPIVSKKKNCLSQGTPYVPPPSTAPASRRRVE